MPSLKAPFASTAHAHGPGGFFLVMTLGLNDALWVSLVSLLLIAVAACTSDVLTQSMIQSSVRNDMRGRAMGTWVIALGMGPVGHLALGNLAAWIGAGMAVAVSGTVLLFIAGVALAMAPKLRSL